MRKYVRIGPLTSENWNMFDRHITDYINYDVIKDRFYEGTYDDESVATALKCELEERTDEE